MFYFILFLLGVFLFPAIAGGLIKLLCRKGSEREIAFVVGISIFLFFAESWYPRTLTTIEKLHTGWFARNILLFVCGWLMIYIYALFAKPGIWLTEKLISLKVAENQEESS